MEKKAITFSSVFFQMFAWNEISIPGFSDMPDSYAARKAKTKTPFICPVCGTLNRDSYQLKRHMRSHTGERPYTCSVCGKTFKRREHLTSHTSSVHDKPKGIDSEEFAT